MTTIAMKITEALDYNSIPYVIRHDARGTYVEVENSSHTIRIYGESINGEWRPIQRVAVMVDKQQLWLRIDDIVYLAKIKMGV